MEKVKSPSAVDKGLIARQLEKKDFHPNVSMQRQIEAHLRQLILEKKLPVATPVPTVRALAKIWSVSTFPVHAAMRQLAQEGLLQEGEGKRLVVAARASELRHVCLYHNAFLTDADEFYSLLNFALYRLLSNRGITTIPYFDDRSAHEKPKVPADLKEMVENSQIDALIASRSVPQLAGWMKSLKIPVANALTHDVQSRVEVDLDAFVARTIEIARRLNRKRIGLIGPPLRPIAKEQVPHRLFTALRKAASEAGIAFECPQLPLSVQSKYWQKDGDLLTEKLLKLKPRPDLIVVYPDIFMRGVASALVRHQVRIPEDIVVVSHRNQEKAIYVPFPMIWLTVKVADFAKALISQIEEQFAGGPAQATLINVSMEESQSGRLNSFQS